MKEINMAENTNDIPNAKSQPPIIINVTPTPINVETPPPVINLPPPDSKQEEKANRIGLLSTCINAGLLLLTLGALWYTAKSVNISAEALQMSRVNDSLSSLRIKASDSINAAVANANKIKDSITLRLSKTSIQSQLKLINETQKEFAIEHEPFLQVSDVKVLPFDDDSVLNLQIELENLTKVPVKITGCYDALVMAEDPVLERNLRPEKLKTTDDNLYVTNSNSIVMNVQSESLHVNEDDFYAQANNGSDLYFLRTVKYRNLSNGKLKFYRFFLKIHPYPVSDINPDGMTEWTLIKNENLDRFKFAR